MAGLLTNWICSLILTLYSFAGGLTNALRPTVIILNEDLCTGQFESEKVAYQLESLPYQTGPYQIGH